MKAQPTNQSSTPPSRPPLFRPPRRHRPQPKELTEAEAQELRVRTEGKFSAHVTQFLYPTGQKRETTTKLPIDGLAAYEEMTKAKCHFEAEVLNRSEVSVTISNGEEDIAIRIVENGPSVQRAMMDMLSEGSWK